MIASYFVGIGRADPRDEVFDASARWLWADPQLKVFDPVVVADSVPVVNILERAEAPAKMLFHDVTMLRQFSSIDAHPAISRCFVGRPRARASFQALHWSRLTCTHNSVVVTFTPTQRCHRLGASVQRAKCARRIPAFARLGQRVAPFPPSHVVHLTPPSTSIGRSVALRDRTFWHGDKNIIRPEAGLD